MFPKYFLRIKYKKSYFKSAAKKQLSRLEGTTKSLQLKTKFTIHARANVFVEPFFTFSPLKTQ